MASRMANEEDLIAQLVNEGFSHTYVWEDAPNARYPQSHARRPNGAHYLEGRNDPHDGRGFEDVSPGRTL